MSDTFQPTPQWIKACGTNACIEVMHTEHGAILRNSGYVDEVVLATAAEWSEFLAAAKAGRFDRPAS
jgi:hypothetical protein